MSITPDAVRLDARIRRDGGQLAPVGLFCWIAAASLGALGDGAGIEGVYRICSFLPVTGVLTIFPPRLPVQRSSG